MIKACRTDAHQEDYIFLALGLISDSFEESVHRALREARRL